MASLIKQFTFVADTQINPSQVNANFDDLVTFCNQQVVHKDGTVAMTGPLVLPASNPTTDNQAARKAYVDSSAGAASTAATNAQNTANTASTNANTALDRVPNKVRWGTAGGTTNGAGDIAFAHGLGGTPSSVVLTPLNATADMDWHVVVENRDPTNVNVRVHNTNNGAAMAGASINFCWFAAI